MKKLAIPILLVLAGIAVAAVNDFTLGSLWTNLGWRKPVADWLLSIGLSPPVAGWWSVMWIKLPDWAVALLCGVPIGLFAAPTKWTRFAFCFGAGLVLYPGYFAVSYCLRLMDYDSSLAFGTFWRLLALNVVSLFLLFLSAWIFRRGGGQPVVVDAKPTVAS